MKKTILAMLLAGSSCAVFAQDSSNQTMGDSSRTYNTNTNTNMNSNMSTDNNSLNSNTSYNAYGSFMATPPEYVQSYVMRDYPAYSGTHWQQFGDWWHGYSVNNGVPAHYYYNMAGQSFIVALPVRQSLVPDAVVSKAVDQFGPTLYDINRLKGSMGQDIYQVRLLENGQLSSYWMDENGTKVIDVYRMETTETTNLNTGNMNSTGTIQTSDADMTTTTGTDVSATDNASGTKMKIKTKTADGKKTKTKVTNGKVVNE